MRKVYVARMLTCIIISFVTVTLVYTQPTPPTGKKWEAVPALSDEFSTWDNTKWWKSLWNYGVPVQMRAENSGVSDGKLWIKATLDEGADRWFETSRVMSYAQISYPMYTECRMKTAHISAYNTFWMNNGNSESRDEFDICENNSKPSITSDVNRPYTMYSQYFIVVNSDVEREHGNFDNRYLSDSNSMKGVKWNEAYHTLGAWWKDENNIQFYINGEEAGSVTSTRDFTRSLNIIWDLWTINATWSGGLANPDDLLDDDINTMYVDWIHTYSLVDGEPGDPTNPTDPTEPTDPTDPTTGLTCSGKNSGNIELYPNPASDILNINLLNPIEDNATVTVYNSLGSLVKKERILQASNQISLSELLPGIYIIKLLNGNATLSELFKKD